MGKAIKMKEAEVVVPTRGRPVQIDDELIEDLTALVKGKAQALDLSPYFTNGENKTKASNQIRKHWDHMGEPSEKLRLDFAQGRIQARVRKVVEAETTDEG